MNGWPFALLLNQFGEEMTHLQAHIANGGPLPDASISGYHLENLIKIVSQFPPPEEVRFLDMLHVHSMHVLHDQVWRPRIDFLIASRVIELGEPDENNRVQALVPPLMLAYMHECYGSLAGWYGLIPYDASRQHFARARELRSPAIYKTGRLLKRLILFYTRYRIAKHISKQ